MTKTYFIPDFKVPEEIRKMKDNLLRRRLPIHGFPLFEIRTTPNMIGQFKVMEVNVTMPSMFIQPDGELIQIIRE